MLAAALLLVAAPAFDCAEARLDAERMICASEALARRDRALALVYRGAEPRTPLFRRGQRRWLAARNRCSTEACLAAAYDARIAALSSVSNIGEEFRHENYVGSLRIAPVGEGWHVVSLMTAVSVIGPDLRIIEATGLVELRNVGGRLAASASCGFAIAREKTRWRVRQDAGCDAAYPGRPFDGEYMTDAEYFGIRPS